jgi:hypothetical protein
MQHTILRVIPEQHRPLGQSVSLSDASGPRPRCLLTLPFLQAFAGAELPHDFGGVLELAFDGVV